EKREGSKTDFGHFDLEGFQSLFGDFNLVRRRQQLNNLLSGVSRSLSHYLEHVYNPDEDYVEVEAKLRGHLESFLEIAQSFIMIYTKEPRPWTNMMDVPQLHGFGPTANCLLEAYKMLLNVTW
ncbi:AUGMIN subunit 7-like, partial [Camellia sinensis]|uniref:AUGMIN subunit 7-like n=1 Tax=Camellia sinensis TaxID=4442 RepID=UPI001036959D